jgi:hypothetical protein
MRSKTELALAIQKFGSALVRQNNLAPLKIKTLNNLFLCRTAALGGHEEACNHCGTVKYSYNSCGDRHCPKCQAAKQAIWIDDLLESTIAVKHFHLVFTVPHALNAVCLHNERLFYDLMFDSVWNILKSFGYTHFGAETGAICVLHTWGQNLSLHPHIHCIVPAAGFSLKGNWIEMGTSNNFLYPVHQLSAAFKGRFLDGLKRQLDKKQERDQFQSHIRQAYETKWVVYSEPSLAGVEHVVKYLGQYTHRVAITNQRIKEITDKNVTFWAKDYKKGGQKMLVTLDGVEFLRRFSLHILPRRFVKIRRYGIYNHTFIKSWGLQFSNPRKQPTDSHQNEKPTSETKIERLGRITGVDFSLCPICKEGHMVRVSVLPRIRSPGFLAYPMPLPE